jgi:hypothetical protein
MPGDCPTGHLPVVLLDGQWLCEHLAILRLLAKRIGQYGKEDIRDYLCDSLADAAAEFRSVCVLLSTVCVQLLWPPPYIYIFLINRLGTCTRLPRQNTELPCVQHMRGF